MNVISVKSSDPIDAVDADDGGGDVDDPTLATAAADSSGEDIGLGREMEDEEDFDEGISDISTKDTIINPSSSNSRYREYPTNQVPASGTEKTPRIMQQLQVQRNAINPSSNNSRYRENAINPSFSNYRYRAGATNKIPMPGTERTA